MVDDSVAAAVGRDIAKLGKDLAESTLALSALALAREIDNPKNSATSKSMCARALLDTMDRLRALAPVETADKLDDLAGRRDRRLTEKAG